MSLHCCVYIAFFKFYGREIYRFNYMRYHISHSSPYINIQGMQLAYSVIFKFYKPCLWSNVYFWTVRVLRGRILYHDLLIKPKDDVDCIWSIKIFLVINDANIGIIEIDFFILNGDNVIFQIDRKCLFFNDSHVDSVRIIL